MLQQLDYLEFIDIYHERICAFHVKDAEFNPSGRQGVYSGFQSWVNRAGRFRSLGDGQVDFAAVFSKLAEYDYDSWPVLEWECALKHPEQGRGRGRALHRRAYHPGHGARLRRFRRRQDGREGKQESARDQLEICATGLRTQRTERPRGSRPMRDGVRPQAGADDYAREHGGRFVLFGSAARREMRTTAMSISSSTFPVERELDAWRFAESMQRLVEARHAPGHSRQGVAN